MNTEHYEMPDGTLRCQTHGLEICGSCGVDYTFMREALGMAENDSDGDIGDDSESDWEPDVDGKKLTVHTCQVCKVRCDRKCTRCKEVYYCSVDHQRQDWKTHKQECSQFDPTSASKPRLLVLAVEGMYEVAKQLYEPILPTLTPHFRVQEVRSEAVALRKLKRRSARPQAVLCIDGLQLKHNPKLIKMLYKFVSKGRGKVVFAFGFPSFMPMNEFDTVWREFGLPWTHGSYHRTTNFLRQPTGPTSSAAVLITENRDTFLESYSMKALHVQNAAAEHVVYGPTRHSVTQSHVFPSRPVAELEEVPVVWANVGKGFVGYIGDVNAEDGSNVVVRAMLTGNCT